MILINNFETEFKGRKFKKAGENTEYVCVGYGDNGSNGNPYLVGLTEGPTPGQAMLVTVLFKTAVFIP